MYGGRGWALLVLLPVLAAVVVLLVRGRGWRVLLAVRLRGLWLVGLAAAVQFARISDPAWAAPVLRSERGLWPVAAIWVLAVAFAVRNARTLPRSARPGLGAFVLGFSLNSLATAANAGMPYSVAAAAMAGVPAAVPVPGHRPVTPDTVLPVLADVLPLPALHQVVSVGDLLMLVGIGWLLVAVGVSGVGAATVS
jgi:hypothetical protein